MVRAYKMTYNPVTPLSCDCAKTLVKSYALAFKPIAGCVVAITGLEFKTMVESCANALFPKAGCVLAARGLFTCHSVGI